MSRDREGWLGGKELDQYMDAKDESRSDPSFNLDAYLGSLRSRQNQVTDSSQSDITWKGEHTPLRKGKYWLNPDHKNTPARMKVIASFIKHQDDKLVAEELGIDQAQIDLFFENTAKMIERLFPGRVPSGPDRRRRIVDALIIMGDLSFEEEKGSKKKKR